MALPKDPVMLLSFVNTQLMILMRKSFATSLHRLITNMTRLSISLSRFSAYILKVMEG